MEAATSANPDPFPMSCNNFLQKIPLLQIWAEAILQLFVVLWPYDGLGWVDLFNMMDFRFFLTPICQGADWGWITLQ